MTSRTLSRPYTYLTALVVSCRQPAAQAKVLSLVDQAVVSGTRFVTSVAIGRIAAASELGVYAMAMAIFFVVEGIQQQLVSTPYAMYWRRRSGSLGRAYAGSVLVHQFALSVLMMVGLLGLAAALSFGYGPGDLVSTTFVLVGTIPFMLLREQIRRMFFAHLVFLPATLLDMAVCALQVVGIVCLAWSDQLTAATACAVIGGACAVSCISMMLWQMWTSRSGPESEEARLPHPHIDRVRIIEDWRENWAFGRWALASHVVGSTAPFLMPWFLGLTHGAQAAGLFAAASSVVGICYVLVCAMVNLLVPNAVAAYSEDGAQGLCHILKQSLVGFTVFLGLFCVFMLLVAEPTVKLLYGDSFASAGAIVIVLSINLLVNSFNLTAIAGLWAVDRPGKVFIGGLCAVLTVLVVAVCLIGPAGPLGAAVSVLAGSIVAAVVRGVLFWQVIREELRPSIPRRSNPQPVAEEREEVLNDKCEESFVDQTHPDQLALSAASPKLRCQINV